MSTIRTNKEMKKLGDFITRTPKKDDFTAYIYTSVDGTSTVISREDLDPEVDEVIYEELKKETNNNRVQIEEHRAYSKDPEKHDALLDTQESSLNLEELIVENLESEALREAIKSLDPYKQKLLTKKYLQGKSNTLIADEEGVKEGTIRYRLTQIIRELEKNLKK